MGKYYGKTESERGWWELYYRRETLKFRLALWLLNKGLNFVPFHVLYNDESWAGKLRQWAYKVYSWGWGESK